VDLIQAFGLDALENAVYEAPTQADEEEARVFHTDEYLAVLKGANDGVFKERYTSYGMGPGDNPVFPGMYDFSLTVLGCTMTAARLIAEKKVKRAFNMAGGMHHAMKDRASGFCFVNDIAVAIEYFLSKKMKVMYVDIDAHHGDGVQAAFYDTNKVMTLSFHESGRSLFPGTGFTDEIGEEKGKGFSVNVPLRFGTDDATFTWAFDQVFEPLFDKFNPDVLVSLVACDMMHTDPLANMNLTSEGFLHAVTKMREKATRWLCLGGGGYNEFNSARLWTLVWALLNDIDLPDELPEEFAAKARAEGFQLHGLVDDPYRMGEWRKQEVMTEAQNSVRDIRRTIFPIHKIKVKKGFFDDLFY